MLIKVQDSYDLFVLLPNLYFPLLILLNNIYIHLFYFNSNNLHKNLKNKLTLQYILLYTKEFFILYYLLFCTVSCFEFTYQITDCWCRYSICYLPNKYHSSSSWSLNYSLQVIQKKIKPTSCRQIIKKMSNPISPYLYLIQSIKYIVIFLLN